jgi:predicted membrane protein
MPTSYRNIWPGLILLILGILFLLNNLEMMSFGYIARTYWPLILILIGLSMLIRSQRPPVRMEVSAPGPASSFGSGAAHGPTSETSADTVSETSVFGNISLKPTSRNFKGGTLSTVFGTIDLNLSSAELATGEQHLSANSVFGSVHITLPKDIGLYVRSTCLLGDITVMNQKKGGIVSDVAFKSDNYDTSTKKLVISASQVLGEIKIW